MHKISRSAVALATLMLSALCAHAEDGEYDRSVFYAGLNVGGAIENFDAVDFDDGYALGLSVGYRVMPHLAVEAQLEYAGFEDEFGPIDVDLDLVTFTTNAKLFILTEQIQPYGLVGIGLMNAQLDAGIVDVDETDFVARFGGGIDYWVTQSISLGIATNYVLTTGDVEDLDYVSVSALAQFHF